MFDVALACSGHFVIRDGLRYESTIVSVHPIFLHWQKFANSGAEAAIAKHGEEGAEKLGILH